MQLTVPTGSLFLAYALWSTFIFALNNCLGEFYPLFLCMTCLNSSNRSAAEMVTWIPISSPFVCVQSSSFQRPDGFWRGPSRQVRFADRFVDPALGFCAGINFFALQAVLVPFEITAFSIVLRFWTDKIPIVAVVCIVLGAYLCVSFGFYIQIIWSLRIPIQHLEYVCGSVVRRCVLNIVVILTPDILYIESEFWLSIGKVTLAIGLMAFTFITMVGGNPLHDKYGFRNWDRVYHVLLSSIALPLMHVQLQKYPVLLLLNLSRQDHKADSLDF